MLLNTLRSIANWRRAVDYAVSLMSALLHLTLERTRVERFQQLKTAQQLRRDAHDGTVIVKLATVVGSGEDRDEDAVFEEFVSVLDNHVSAADQIKLVTIEKLENDALSE